MAAAVRTLTLPGVPESVRRFRELAREASATEYQAEAAALCVSELVTNAILHTLSGRPGGSVTVEIEPGPRPGLLRISVEGDVGRPVSEPSPGNGYGLGIVDAVAADWGAVLVGRDCGSCYWCEIPDTAPPAPVGVTFTPGDEMDILHDALADAIDHRRGIPGHQPPDTAAITAYEALYAKLTGGAS